MERGEALELPALAAAAGAGPCAAGERRAAHADLRSSGRRIRPVDVSRYLGVSRATVSHHATPKRSKKYGPRREQRIASPCCPSASCRFARSSSTRSSRRWSSLKGGNAIRSGMSARELIERNLDALRESLQREGYDFDGVDDY